MADDEQQRPTEARGERDVREHEDEARRRRTGAESERAAAEREAEQPGGSADEQGVIPTDADQQRRGVMPPQSE